MQAGEIDFFEMELRFVRAIRRGRELSLVGPALRREAEIEAKLANLRSGADNILPMAVDFVGGRDADPDPNHRTGGGR